MGAKKFLTQVSRFGQRIIGGNEAAKLGVKLALKYKRAKAEKRVKEGIKNDPTKPGTRKKFEEMMNIRVPRIRPKKRIS